MILTFIIYGWLQKIYSDVKSLPKFYIFIIVWMFSIATFLIRVYDRANACPFLRTGFDPARPFLRTRSDPTRPLHRGGSDPARPFLRTGSDPAGLCPSYRICSLIRTSLAVSCIVLVKSALLKWSIFQYRLSY